MMDHVLENKFLNNEKAYKKVYTQEEIQQVLVESGTVERDEVLYQIYDSFVKEKHSLILYIYESLIYSASLQKIDITSWCKEELLKRDRLIKQEVDAFNIKNRVIMIVSASLFTQYLLIVGKVPRNARSA